MDTDHNSVIELLSENLLQLTLIVTELQKQQKNFETIVASSRSDLSDRKKLNSESCSHILSINTDLFCDDCNKLSISTFICSTKICSNIIKKCRFHITPEFLDNIFCDECLIKNEISDYIEHSEDN